MKISRKQFFDGFRDHIDSSISQEQVDGLEFLLGEMENDPLWKDIRHISYALATAGHETAWSFQPVEEGYYLGSSARVKAFQKTLRYYPYFGRGYVQLTWKKNYEKAGKILNLDLVNNPELALEKHGAYLTMTHGMHKGWFTGRKLSDYISGSKCDYKEARRIINGTDKAALIAGFAVQFEKILKDSAADSPAINSHTKQTSPQSSTSLSDPQKEPPPIIEQPQGNIETPIVTKVEKTITENDAGTSTVTKTQQEQTSPAVEVMPVKPSAWSMLIAFGTTIFGYYTLAKENFGSLVSRAEDAVDIRFVMNAAVGAGLVVLGVWLYNKSKNRAAAQTKNLIIAAADHNSNTVVLVDKPAAIVAEPTILPEVEVK